MPISKLRGTKRTTAPFVGGLPPYVGALFKRAYKRPTVICDSDEKRRLLKSQTVRVTHTTIRETRANPRF